MTFQPTRRSALIGAFAGVGLASLSARAFAQPLSPGAAAIDQLVRDVMAATPDQPGLAVAVVENGQITLTKGYGVRRLGSPALVDEHTLFGIASNTKHMTAALLAMLVDEGKVEWDQPVTKYMPEFAMSDPAVTKMITVRDLLVHRSGLTLGAGDLMMWPTPVNRTREQLVEGMRYLPLGTGFRSGFAYDNVLYIVAGALIERLTGRTFEEVLKARVLDPLGMTESAASPVLLNKTNYADAHTRLGPPMRGMGEMKLLPFDEQFALAAPAGGVWTNAHDIARWMQLLLGQGQMPNGKRLWSEEQNKELWAPQTIVSTSEGPMAEEPNRATIRAYALGMFVQDHRGERSLQHSGGLSGYISYTALLPGRRSGLMVMTNAEEGNVLYPIAYGGLDRLQGRSDFDWIAWRKAKTEKSHADALKEFEEAKSKMVAAGGAPSLPLAAYAGVYQDPWYGTITVKKVAKGLAITFDRSKELTGKLEPWSGDTFRTRFARSDMEDALFTFEVENGAVKGATAKALSPLADFSFDYQDLHLTKVA